MTSASGSNIPLIGQTVVKLHTGGNTLDVPMVVAKDISHDCLLGSDFFHTHRCRIQYDLGTISINEAEIPISYQKKTPVTRRIVLNEATTLQSGTEQLVSATLERGYE